MTKYQKAFHFFRKLPYRIPLKFANDEFCKEYDKSLALIKELVDKATPKKSGMKMHQSLVWHTCTPALIVEEC